MPKSRKKFEGYLVIDHRDSPGISEADAKSAPAHAGVVPTDPYNKLFESATVTCAMCCAIVVLNPDRSRPRNYHPETDRYICDECAALRASGFTVSADQAFDYAQEQLWRAAEGYNPLAPLNKASPILKAIGLK